MKTEIYYFTGTGNSLDIAKKIDSSLDHSELVSIPKQTQKNEFAVNSERVGFVFPLYFGGLPKIVYDFISKSELRKAKYIFAVVTRKSSPGRAIYEIQKLLKKKKLKLDAGFKINMPGNYVPLYNVPDKETEEKILKKAYLKTEEIIKIVFNNEKKIENDPFLIRNLLKPLNRYFFKKDKDKDFYVTENCTSCGLCEKICPVDNIELRDGRPIWLHHCEECLACLHYCPESAIQKNKKSEKHGRYRNPNVKLINITK